MQFGEAMKIFALTSFVLALSFSLACVDSRDLSASGGQKRSAAVCGLPSVDAPATRPMDPCRDGSLVFGPELLERDRGRPTVETHSFDTAGEMHGCVSIVTSGSGRQRVSGSWIDLDGKRIAGPKLFGQNVTTVEQRQVLPAGNHVLEAQLRGPPDTWAEVSVYAGGDGTRHGLVTSDHLELFNLFADPQTFHGDVEPTRLTASGTALRLPGLPSGDAFQVRWRFEILSVASCAPVRTLSGESVLGAVATFAPEAHWDGLDDAGAEAPEGTYGYRLIADLVRVSRAGDTVLDSLATAVQTVELDRIEGWVDFHTHPMSHLGFGEKAMYGAPDMGMIIPAGNLACNDEPVRASSIEEALGNCNGPHGGWGVSDNPCGDYMRAFLVNLVDSDYEFGGAFAFDHPHAGYPDFEHWPHQTSLLHQQMWWEWMKRARDGGLRVVVALAVNSELLAEILNGTPPYDDRSVAYRQIAETIRMVAQHGDIMEIARSSDDVLRIAADGKLAVVLGMEVDRIGNFGVNSFPSEAAIRDEIRFLHSLGVRYVFPVHLVDNAFGGAAVYHPLFSFANKRANGYHFRVETSSDRDVIYDGAALVDFFPFSPAITYVSSLITLASLHASLNAIGALPAPCFDDSPPCIGLVSCCSSYQELTNILAPSSDLDGYFLVEPGHVNVLGLTARGEIAIDEMMKLGMIIDLDHMSEKTMRRVIDLAEGTEPVAGAGYPLVFGHTALRGLRCGDDAHCSERSPSSILLQRVARLGGMVGTGSAKANPINFIDTYLHIQAFMGPDSVGIGTDANGFEMLPRTLLTEDAECVPDEAASADFYSAFLATMPEEARQKSKLGDREWDYVKECGVSHYGLMPEFLFDIRAYHGNEGAQVYQSMMRSTVGFVRMWQKIEEVSAQLE
jgi:microsomal dipeptidase-like Zn-dependent dipeptidase